MAKVEASTVRLFGRFSYSPMPRTGAAEDAEKPIATSSMRKMAFIALLVVFLVGGVVCVVFTVAAASSLSHTERHRHTSFRLQASEEKPKNRTATTAAPAPLQGPFDQERPSRPPEPPRCCASHTAKCLSCEAKTSIARFCLRQGHGNIMGCEGFCGLNEDSFNYPGGDIISIDRPTSQACCAACREHRQCTSWTWSKEPTSADYRTCYLKDQLQLRREPDMAYISGLPGHDSLTFQIRTRRGDCLDVRSIQHKQGVDKCSKATARFQKWSYDRITGQIENTNLGQSMCLDARQADKPGSSIFLHKCGISFMSQRWVYDSITGQIENSFGFCLDLLPAVAKATMADRPHSVRLQPCTTEGHGQRWLFSAGSGQRLPTPTMDMTSTSSTSSWTSSTSSSTSTASTTLEGVLTSTATATQTRDTTLTKTTTSTVQGQLELSASDLLAAASLFCFSLMLPWGYEPDLLRMQITERRSIFACEDFVVYSSVALDLGSGYTTSRIDMDLHCPLGGQYHTALNTPIFQKIWQQVIKDGRFRVHAWTVKADPDCVFLPSRLRDIVLVETLRSSVESGKGLFLNNCRFGLHGPLEVLSRRALEEYGEGWHKCRQPPQEDVYLQHCMLTLGVMQMNQFNLLAEAACRSPDWQDCHSPQAAFHPFKSLGAYRTCQSEAEKNGTWSRSQVKAEKATAETIGVDPETAKWGTPFSPHGEATV